MPAAAITAPSRITPLRSRCGSDPSASRMPNSRVRALTENASTPPTPTTAIANATAANTPNTSEFKRSGVSTSARMSSRVAACSNRLICGYVANHLRDRRDERIRIYAGVDEKATAKHWTLFKGAIDGESGLRNDISVVNIGGDADDAMRRHKTRLFEIGPGEELQHGIRPIDMPIDGIMIGEHTLCEGLADDNDGLFFTLAIEIVEIAAGH